MHKLPLNDSGLYVEFATKEELMLIAANMTNLASYREFMMHTYPDMSYEAIYQTYADHTTRDSRLRMIHTASHVKCSDGRLLVDVILEIKKPNPVQPNRDINLMM